LWANRLTALETEFRRSWQLGSALRAGQCLAPAALQAKLGLRWILVRALRTFHAESLPVVKRTKLEEMLDEKRQEVGSLSPQQDTGRLRQLEREIRYLESMLR
jgi:hypothetical protein